METNTFWDASIHCGCYTPQQRKGKVHIHQLFPSFVLCFITFNWQCTFVWFKYPLWSYYYSIITSNATLVCTKHEIFQFRVSLQANWNGNILIPSATKCSTSVNQAYCIYLLILKMVWLCSWFWHKVNLSKVRWLVYMKNVALMSKIQIWSWIPTDFPAINFPCILILFQ